MSTTVGADHAPCRVLPARVALVTIGALIGCPSGPEIPEPDLSRIEPQVVAVLIEAREAVRETPRSAAAWGELGSLYDAHLITDPAALCYRRAHELDPEDFRWVYLLAIARELQGAGAEELNELFGRAAALDPDYAPLRVRLGDALWRRGHHSEAIEQLRRAIDLAPATAVAHRRLGQVILSTGDPEEAAKHLARAVTLEPRDLTAYAGLAQALMRLGQTERARQIRERARGLEPVTSLQDPVYANHVFMRNSSSGAAFARGVAAVQENAYDQAVQDLTLVLEVRPEDGSAHYWLGTAHQRAGRPEAALRHLTRAVELDPALAQARRQLAELLTAMGRHDEARLQLEAADRLKPAEGR